MNVAPTAYDDLVSLFDSSSSIFEIAYKTLPNPLKELITNLPDMLTPEVLRTMTPISPALKKNSKTVLKLRTLATQGTITGMFRTGVNALKLRFPILLSEGAAVGLSVFVLCSIVCTMVLPQEREGYGGGEGEDGDIWGEDKDRERACEGEGGQRKGDEEGGGGQRKRDREGKGEGKRKEEVAFLIKEEYFEI